ncbi:MalM family protein [Rhodanobacter sp. Si-c]|uniref:MalM family protein n=1 Tax=Rhodanobacter lycopersici TaxID=3162487 RepID=A0ABV3QH99_9GAMM
MKHRFPALFLALAAGVLLAGCHTVKDLVPTSLVPPNLRAPENSNDPLKQAQQRLLDATPCCTSFADFSYQSLLPWQPQPFTLGSGSSVANINGTHSYFLAFRLPEAAKLPYRVAFKSELNGRWLKSSYLFAPTVVLLDSGFQPIGSDDISLCEHMGWSDATSGAFGSVTVASKQARYLLVYSSAAQQGGKTYWEQSPAAFSAQSTSTSMPTLDMGSSGTFSVPHGPDGTIWVGMMNSSYAKAVDNAVCKKPKEGDGVLNTLRSALPLPWSSNTSSTDTGSAAKTKGS